MPALDPILKNLIDLATAFDNYEPAERPSVKDIAAAELEAKCRLLPPRGQPDARRTPARAECLTD